MRPGRSRREPSSLASRPKLSAADLFDECLGSLLSRPGRAAFTVLGTVLGVGALVATLGLSKTAGNQIVGRFDQLAATDIVVTPKTGSSGRLVTSLPWDGEQRMRRLNGVTAAGTLSDVDVQGALVGGVPVQDPTGQSRFRLPVKAASPGLYEAVRARLASGRLPDAGHSQRADRVVVLGPNAADRFHITRLETQPAIYIGDRLYVVIGILASVGRQPALLDSVVIPEGTRNQGVRAGNAWRGAGGDPDRRGAAHRRAGTCGAQPFRPQPAQGDGAAGAPARTGRHPG